MCTFGHESVCVGLGLFRGLLLAPASRVVFVFVLPPSSPPSPIRVVHRALGLCRLWPFVWRLRGACHSSCQGPAAHSPWMMCTCASVPLQHPCPPQTACPCVLPRCRDQEAVEACVAGGAVPIVAALLQSGCTDVLLPAVRCFGACVVCVCVDLLCAWVSGFLVCIGGGVSHVGAWRVRRLPLEAMGLRCVRGGATGACPRGWKGLHLRGSTAAMAASLMPPALAGMRAQSVRPPPPSHHHHHHRARLFVTASPPLLSPPPPPRPAQATCLEWATWARRGP